MPSLIPTPSSSSSSIHGTLFCICLRWSHTDGGWGGGGGCCRAGEPSLPSPTPLQLICIVEGACAWASCLCASRSTHDLKPCMCCFAVAFLLQRQPTELQPPIGGHRTAQRRLGQAQPAACVPSVLEDALHPSVASHPRARPVCFHASTSNGTYIVAMVVKFRSDYVPRPMVWTAGTASV
jgi:hypothetical protein